MLVGVTVAGTLSWLGLMLLFVLRVKLRLVWLHLNSGLLQRPGQSGTVTRSSFYPSKLDGTEALRPLDRRIVASRPGGKLGITQQLAGIADSRKMNGVEMSISADDDAS